ncbi:MAG: sugar transferase [Chthoniobacterales bacterium]
MLVRKQEINLQINQITDAAMLAIVFWGCYLLRHHRLINVDFLPDIAPFSEFLWILAVIVPFGPFLLELQGFYQYPIEKTIWKSLIQITRAGVWLGLLIAICVIFFKLSVPSRSVVLLFLLLAPVALILRERLFIGIYLTRMEHGQARELILVAGEPKKMQEVIESMTILQRMELKIAEEVNLEENSIGFLVDKIHSHSVGRVILAFSSMDLDHVQKAIEACEIEGVETWLCADFIKTSIARPTYELLGNRPMLVFRSTPEVSWALLVKTAIDKSCAIFGLVMASPVFLLVYVLMKITSPGPVLFSQRRAGLHGKPFTMYKFRSMNSNAEMQRHELEIHNEMQGPVFKIAEDPRVTRFGKWLRKTSLDELPQLWNVLKGEMSLVGPRPLPLYEVDKFESLSHRRRLSMRPGLTCLWQVEGRSNVSSFDDWVRLDLKYIDSWSLLLDAYILIRTIPAVLMGLGAK